MENCKTLNKHLVNECFGKVSDTNVLSSNHEKIFSPKTEKCHQGTLDCGEKSM